MQASLRIPIAETEFPRRESEKRNALCAKEMVLPEVFQERQKPEFIANRSFTVAYRRRDKIDIKAYDYSFRILYLSKKIKGICVKSA